MDSEWGILQAQSRATIDDKVFQIEVGRRVHDRGGLEAIGV